jgi:hypothetical protein
MKSLAALRKFEMIALVMIDAVDKHRHLRRVCKSSKLNGMSSLILLRFKRAYSLRLPTVWSNTSGDWVRNPAFWGSVTIGFPTPKQRIASRP